MQPALRTKLMKSDDIPTINMAPGFSPLVTDDPTTEEFGYTRRWSLWPGPYFSSLG